MAWSDLLGEKYPAESVLLATPSLTVAAAGVIGEILSHGCVRVQPDLAQAEAASVVLGESEERTTDPAALRRWHYRNIFQEQIVISGNEHDQASRLRTCADGRLRGTGWRQGSRWDPGTGELSGTD
jgi:hypothetical protein